MTPNPLPIAYIMSRFPKISETFILREILELRRQGQPVYIFPLISEGSAVRHSETQQLEGFVRYTPFCSASIFRKNLKHLLCEPGDYFAAFWALLSGNYRSPSFLWRAIVIFPKSVWLANEIRKLKVAHIHAHFATHPALVAFLIWKLTGIRFSFTAHAHDIFVNTTMLKEKMAAASFVVTISDFNKKLLLSQSPLVHQDKIKVIRCGVELDRYALRTPIGRPEPFEIANVGSLETYKGTADLVRACALLKKRGLELSCNIVGDGPLRPSLEALIAQLDLTKEVCLVGSQPQENVASIIRNADVFALPSTVAKNGQMEGVPVAIMEAMASQLPVVSTRISGIPELVSHGLTGLLVQPGDVNALADALEYLKKNEAERREMGKRGQEIVASGYDLTKNVAELRTQFDAYLPNETIDIESIIRKRYAALRPGGPDSDHVGISLSPRSEGRDSQIFDLNVSNGSAGPERLILKLHRPLNSSAQNRLNRGKKLAENEFEVLSSLWNDFSHRSSRLIVPEPKEYFPEIAGLVLEKVEGKRLDHLMRWNRLTNTVSHPSGLISWFRSCGQWLALFHQVTAATHYPKTVYTRIERNLRSNLELCCKVGLPQQLASALENRYQREKERVFFNIRSIVGHHCDFAPHNVLISLDKVTVLDFEGFEPGIFLEDLCRFLAVLESAPPYHLSSTVKGNLRKAFLDGYGLDRIPNKLDLELMLALEMAALMARSRVGQEASRNWAEKWKARRQFHFYCQWFESYLRC